MKPIKAGRNRWRWSVFIILHWGQNLISELIYDERNVPLRSHSLETMPSASSQTWTKSSRKVRIHLRLWPGKCSQVLWWIWTFDDWLPQPDTQTDGGREMMVTWRDISHNHADHITPSCFITTLASRQLVQHHDCRRGQEVACPVEKAKTRLKVLLQFWLFIILKVCICVNAVSDLQVRKWKTGTRKW